MLGGGGGGAFFFLFFFLSFFLLFFEPQLQTYDSWRLGHVVPDDVIIAEIGDQALDIFLHGPESTHKNGIEKTFTHTSIPIQPCTLLKQSKTLNSPNMTPSFLILFQSTVVVGDGQEAWQMLLSTAPRRRPSRLGPY